jgi:hypothetical protein
MPEAQLLLRIYAGGGCFAWVGEQNPGWVNAEAEDCAHLFNGGAVKPAVAFAREVGVLRTTFDNIDELDAIKIHMPEAQLFAYRHES